MKVFRQMTFQTRLDYQEEGTPVCEAYTSTCDNNKVSTFDGNNVPIYEQKNKKCGFKVFTSEKNGVSVKGMRVIFVFFCNRFCKNVRLNVREKVDLAFYFIESSSANSKF